MKAVYAVGSCAGLPFEVWALFTSRGEAERYAQAAAYTFEVFALPVYGRYAETPAALRPTGDVTVDLAARAIDEVTITDTAVAAGDLEPAEAGYVVAVGDFESTQLPEVRLLFARETDARHYLREALAAAAGQQWSRQMRVYASYDECPPGERHDRPGPALSQLVTPR
jgi:hypothetical protein